MVRRWKSAPQSPAQRWKPESMFAAKRLFLHALKKRVNWRPLQEAAGLCFAPALQAASRTKHRKKMPAGEISGGCCFNL
jgi:hypothetical protein